MSYPYARINVESPGNILTASNYNAEHDNHINNNIFQSIDDYSANATQSNAKSNPGPVGTEILATSGAGELEQLRYVIGRIIDGATGGHRDIPTKTLDDLANLISSLSLHTPGYVENLAITRASTTTTIKGINGSSLSTNNPGKVVVPSTSTAGLGKELLITSDIAFTDAVITSAGAFGGLTAGNDWNTDMPLFLYVANKSNSNIDGADGSSVFFFSRLPHLITTPSDSSYIFSSNSSSAFTDERNIFICQNATVANYTGLPCILVGVMRGRYASSAWAIQTPTSNDGFGIDVLNRAFAVSYSFPTNQMGANSGKYLANAAGTAPTWSTQQYYYKINRNGEVAIHFRMQGDGGTDGSGSVNTQIAVPFIPSGVVHTADTLVEGNCTLRNATLNYMPIDIYFNTSSISTTLFQLYRQVVSTSNLQVNITAIQHSAFSNGARDFYGSIRYTVANNY